MTRVSWQGLLCAGLALALGRNDGSLNGEIDAAILSVSVDLDRFPERTCAAYWAESHLNLAFFAGLDGLGGKFGSCATAICRLRGLLTP